ncbi:MAG: hypothetical protein JWR09_2040 [Mucilaginibacter sp.]|nr:hypothetical protein [Mucilaginibacter sp.]
MFSILKLQKNIILIYHSKRHILTITVFTRYGSVIYKSIGYVNAWDGTCNGSALPVGTYYYILDIKNGKKPLSGFVTILR